MAGANAEFVRRWNERWNAGDLDWLVAVTPREYVFEVHGRTPAPGLKRTYVGPEGTREFWATWGSEMWEEPLKIRIERIIENDEDHVPGLVTLVATGKGSGVPVEMHYAPLVTSARASRCGPTATGAGSLASPPPGWSPRPEHPGGRDMLGAVLHHVSLEVPPAEVDRTVEFWSLLGFERLDAPEEIAQYVTWLERGSNQIHLIHNEQATVPVLGHPAVVAEDFDETVAGLREAGFTVEDADQLWGQPRAFAIGPADHRVELMAAPPDQGKAG